MAKKVNKKFSRSNKLRFLARGFVGATVFGVLFFPSLYAAANKHTAPIKPTSTKSTSQHLKTGPKAAVQTPKPVSAVSPHKTNVKSSTQTSSSLPQPPPVVIPSPGSSVSSLTPTNPTAPPANSTTPPDTSAVASSYTSTNWSGYMATAGSYTSTSGSWNVTRATGNGTSTSADGTWIGIGGVSTNDLIQVGTQNIIAADGTASTSAFYELLPATSQNIPTLTVNQGDSISASLTKLSGSQWNITITDNTSGQSFTTTVTYASSLSSAEWIEEDPSYSSGQQVPFDNFGIASFSNGLATNAGVSNNLAGNQSLPITMVNVAGQPIATPSAISSSGGGFSVIRNGVN
jgi:hypothetical protein